CLFIRPFQGQCAKQTIVAGVLITSLPHRYTPSPGLSLRPLANKSLCFLSPSRARARRIGATSLITGKNEGFCPFSEVQKGPHAKGVCRGVCWQSCPLCLHIKLSCGTCQAFFRPSLAGRLFPPIILPCNPHLQTFHREFFAASGCILLCNPACRKYPPALSG